MKKVMSIAAIALMMAGSTAFACDGCGCKEKKADKKAECSASSCSKEKCGDKKCDKEAKKECGKKACTKK